MNTYISLLRGINVTGNKIIKMADLKRMYESLGFSNVTTYIQSGNVLFAARQQEPATLSETITGAIKKRFGFDVKVLVLLPDALKKVIRKNPFVGRRGVDQARLYVTFLVEKPSPALVKGLEPLVEKSNDEYQVMGTEIFLHCPTGYGKTLLNNTFFEKNLKVAAPTRNWNTVNILASMANEAAFSRI